MIWDWLSAFTKIRNSQKLYADDNIDKINRSTIVIFFIIAGLFIGSRSFGATITCLKPTVDTLPITIDYVNSWCLVKETLRLNNFFSDPIIENKEKLKKINSYAWLMLNCFGLSFTFYIPYLIWKIFVRKNTYQNIPIDVNSVVNLLKNSYLHKKDDFIKNINAVSEYLDRCFSLNNFNDGYLDENEDFSIYLKNENITNKEPKTYTDRLKKRKIRGLHVPLAIKYLFIKLLYLTNSVLIFFIIPILFQFPQPFFSYGFDMYLKYTISDLGLSEQITQSYFPYHVLCDVQYLGDLKHVQTQTYQCSLPANVFNEKVFIILWALLVCLVLLNLYSFIKWIVKLIFRKNIIRNMLIWPVKYNYHIDKYLDSFVYEYLSSEGFLMLMLIKSNTQDWHCRTIVRILWKSYISRIKDDAELTPKPDDNNNNAFTSSTIKLVRRDYNYPADNLEMSTPIKTNLNSLKSAEKECKNNFRKEELKNLKANEEMV